MIIHRDCFVSLAYRLQLNSGEYIRGSAKQPEILNFVAGYKELLPALENKLLGLKTGDECQFTIPTAEAFGLRDPWLVQEWQKKRFPADPELRPGMAVIPHPCAIEMAYPYKILEVKDEVVVLDQNHPLAGEDLHYAVKILEVRPAKPEELEPLQKCETCTSGMESCGTS
jgi:FKBP-type peptidyl-prolyl cis-trans isomerase SlyD